MANNKMKYILTAGVLAVAIGGVAFFMSGEGAIAKGNQNPVVAVVNGDEIHKEDVADVMGQLGPQMAANADAVYPMILDQLINEKLLDEEISKSGLGNDPEVQERLAKAKEQIVRTVYLERRVSNVVTDDAVKAEYKKFESENKGKKEIHARHILVKTEDEAKNLIKELDGGADFAKLASEHSIGPTKSRGGDLGYFTEEAMVPEFADVAFKTEKGTYAKAPVKTQFGWHVIYVEDMREKTLPKLAEIEEGIKAKLGQKALDTLVKDLRETATIERFDMNGQPLAN